MTFITKNLLAASVTAGLMCLAQTASAATVQFVDPVPNGDAPNCGGISYEWTVGMDGKDEASFVRQVGAKSWNEPPPGYALDNDAWTHTSDWVALELADDAMVEITIARQEGVLDENSVVQRNMLVPAMSIFEGWEESSCEDHRYLNDGDTDWMNELTYLDNAPNWKGKDTVKYRAKLHAGKYSIAIGGNPKRLDDYSILSGCSTGATDAATCYAYTGRHGYRVEIETHGKRHHGHDNDHK